MARRVKRQSASRMVPLTRSVKRDKIEGGRGGGRQRRPRQPNWVGLLSRLRRIELALSEIISPGTHKGLDLEALGRDILVLRNDAGSDNQGEALQVPLEGAPDGEVEGDP